MTGADSTNRANGGETASGSGSPITVTGLTNEDSYTFTVTATNVVGTGPSSAPSNAVVPGMLPTISSVAPGQLPEGATKVDVTIEGSGFVTPTTVSISGTLVFPTLVSVAPDVITIDVSVGAEASLGARDVTVSDANGSATCTGCLRITAFPTLTSASPPSVTAGTSISVTFTGSGFEAGATIKFGGPSTLVKAVKKTIVVTATTLTATITVPAGAATGAYTVKITNPDLSVATCKTCFAVT